MRKLFTILSLAVALLAVSCSEDTTTDLPIGGNGTTDSPVEGDEPMTYITVGIDDNTRIGVGEEENGKVALYWSEGDKLMVNKTTESGEVAEEYAGKNTAVIGVPAATTYPMTLVYPYAASTKSAKWFLIQDEQTYTPGKLANGWAILMGVAEEAGDVVRLEHMCGYMKVSLTGSTTVKRVMLRTIGHEPISGYFKYPTTSTTDGEIGMVPYVGADALADGWYSSPVVAINCGDGVALSGESTDFTFALPVANYSKGFELTIVDATGKQQCHTAYTSSGKEVVAGSLIEMPTLAVDCKEDQGIYNGNELAGYVRTLEKDVWLDVTDGKTLHLRGEADLSGEDFSDITTDARKSAELFFWRVSGDDRYNCGSITTIDGHGNAITNHNGTVSAEAAGLLFHEIPATMTVKNLTLGKTADNPATDANEADCTLTATGTGEENAFGAFCYNLLGTIDNCNNYAKVNVTGTTVGAINVGGIQSGVSTSVGTVSNSTNYGYIYCDASNVTGSLNLVGGVASTDTGELVNCSNAGPVTVANSAKAAYVGGVVGYVKTHTITGASNSGSVTLSNAKVGCRVGGVIGCTEALVTSCTNTGNITTSNSGTTHIGGVVGTNVFDGQTFKDCINGEQNTEKGKLTVTKSNNLYAGGIVGCITQVVAVADAVNYGPIAVNGSVAYLYIGCVGGWTETAGATYTNCTNYGPLTVKATTTKAGYSYIGGISGTNTNNVITVSNSANYGDFTIDASTVKVRYGGIAGNLGNNVSNCHAEFDITVDQVAASSAIGGFAGYMPKNGAVIDGCSYKGTITNNDPDADATVKIASLFASSQNITCRATSVEPTMVNNAGAPAFGLIGGAVTTSRTLTVGAADKPFQISKKSKFLGISVSESTVTNHSSDEGASGKAYLDCSSDANKFTITKTNLVYVD